MRKISLLLFAALAFGLLANFTIVHASQALDPQIQRVGLVVAYTPQQSITIVDKDGKQFTFTLAAALKIVPKHRANLLAPGVYVTIIAPKNGTVATGIVIHPHAPSSFTMPSATFTATAVPTNTATNTATALPSETPTETSTATPTNTEVPTATMTATETPTITETSTSTATATPTGTAGTTSNSQSVAAVFIDWLKLIFS
jgi:hypothetical protein